MSTGAAAARAATVGVAVFAGLVAVLHPLRRDLDPVGEVVSRYALGSYGRLLTLALVALGVGSAALVVALHASLSPPARSRTGLALLGVWSLGGLLAAAFPVNPPGFSSGSGRVHTLAVTAGFLSLTVAAFLVPLRSRLDPAWDGYPRTGLVLALAVTGSLLAFATGPEEVKGLTERVLLATQVAWLLVTARQATRATRPARP